MNRDDVDAADVELIRELLLKYGTRNFDHIVNTAMTARK